MEGFIQGLHRSQQKGFNVEFADFREYTKGDDIRHVDWRVFARTDRFYIREFEEETSMRGYLLLDQSRSMDFGAGDRNKLDYACRLAAALAYLLVRQGDAASLTTFDQGVSRYLPPRNTPQQLQRIWSALETLEATGGSDIPRALHGLASTLKRRGLIVLISDLLEAPKRVLQALAHFRRKRFDVIVFHVLAAEELEFPYRGDYRFQDLETAERVEASSHAIREVYLNEFGRFLQVVERGCRQNAIDYVRMSTSEDLTRALGAYLTRRLNLGSLG